MQMINNYLSALSIQKTTKNLYFLKVWLQLLFCEHHLASEQIALSLIVIIQSLHLLSLSCIKKYLSIPGTSASTAPSTNNTDPIHDESD